MSKPGSIFLLIYFCVTSVSIESQGTGDKLEFVSQQFTNATGSTGQVVIKFKADRVKKFIRENGVTPLKTLVTVLNLPPGTELDESMFSKWVKNDRRKKKLADHGIDWSRFMHLKLPAGLTPEKCIELLKNHPLVEYVEKESIGSGGATYPNDPHFADVQWYLAGSTGSVGRIFAPEMWDITTGTSSVIVAVLDTGCDTNLSEFTGRIVPGYNFVSGNTNVMDDHGHGTKVSSILCAKGNNNDYGAGVDWNCKLMPVKILDSGNNGLDTACANGIYWAVTNGAKIINLSAGWGSSSIPMFDAITNALTQGVVFVTITHNYPAYLSMTFPGTMPEVITVGASDTNGERCSFSLFGSSVDLVAPGTNMYVVGLNGTQTWGSANWGTSYAAPQVAGVAALICSLRPELNNQQVADLLCAGAENRVSPTNGCDDFVGWGVLNAYNSLLLAQTKLGEITITNESSISLSWGCPSNASNRQPFKVGYASAITGTWTAVSNISYGTTNAVWVDADSTNASTRFYRVQVKQF